MRSALGLVVAIVMLSGCGGQAGQGGQGDRIARDPGPPTSSVSAGALAQPVPDGPVTTRQLVTVRDDGRGPRLCLGPVAESYPPQCDGLAMSGWDWQGIGRGMFDRSHGVRWGEYVVTGTWDGVTFAATDAIPAAVYDPAEILPSPAWPPSRDYSDAELQRIAEELMDRLPGALTTSPAGGGHVGADVVYDDGSLQAWADQEYGEHVVLVVSAIMGP